MLVDIAEVPRFLHKLGYVPKRKTKPSEDLLVRVPDGTYDACTEEIQYAILEMCESREIIRVVDIQKFIPKDGEPRSVGAIRAHLKKMCALKLIALGYESHRGQLRDVVAKDWVTLARAMRNLM